MRKLLLTTTAAVVLAMPAFAGGVTDKDVELATFMDAVAG